jgi:hypothetical protein
VCRPSLNGLALSGSGIAEMGPGKALSADRTACNAVGKVCACAFYRICGRTGPLSGCRVPDLWRRW